MAEYLLLLLSVCVNVTGSAVNNRFSKQRSGAASVCAYNLLVSAAALIVILLAGGVGSCSLPTLVMGLIFGILNACSIIARTAALSCGPMSLTLLIGSCGMLIPTFSGAIFWNESLGGTRVVGVALMVLSLVFVMDVGVDRALSMKWAGFSLVSFLCTGFISIMQKVQQNSDAAAERTAFLAVAFCVSVLINGVRLIMAMRRDKAKLDLRQIAGGAVSGGCTGVIHTLNLYLSGVIPAVVFFPLVNGGAILLSGIVGSVVFREKCTKRQAAGFAIGVAAILFIGGLFG